MSLQQSRDPWSRLIKAARDVRDERDTAAPYGFGTRVTALAFASERRVASAFDRFALRALGVASLLALGSVALNYPAISVPAPTSASIAAAEELMLPIPTDDTVSLVLDFAD